VAFLAPQLGAPPCARGLLRLTVIENGYPVRVLQIVAGADFLLDITTLLPSDAAPATYLLCRAGDTQERNPSRDHANGARTEREGAAERSGFRDLSRGQCEPLFYPFWGAFGE
jgi:hypothetical protein